MKNYKYKIINLDCPNCANELEEKLKHIKLISNVSISFMAEKLTFTCEEDEFAEAIKEIKKTIKKNEPDVEIEEC